MTLLRWGLQWAIIKYMNFYVYIPVTLVIMQLTNDTLIWMSDTTVIVAQHTISNVVDDNIRSTAVWVMKVVLIMITPN
jgi:hypothetical protein